MNGLPSTLLDPLRRFRAIEDSRFRRVEPDQIPAPMGRLLVHSGDMTSRLEGFHQSRIILEVLQVAQAGEGQYYREVLLKTAGEGVNVEYGAIEIFLDTLPELVREKILEGKFPLGGLLNEHGVQYHGEPQAYFEVSDEPAFCGLLGVALGSVLYGRCNILRTENGGVVARILEVLPPLSEASVTVEVSSR
jgi:chorismate-pyruvate lyase